MNATPADTHNPAALDRFMTIEQRQRALALHEARAVLRTQSSAFSARPLDVVELIEVAEWIIDGEDPWDDEAPTGEGANPEAAKIPDHGIGPFGMRAEPVGRSGIRVTGSKYGNVPPHGPVVPGPEGGRVR